MHELQLMQQVVRLVDDVCRNQDHGHPVIIRLQISSHSHLAHHSLGELQTTFQIAAHGTPAQAAQLEIVTLPTQGVCQICGEQIERTIDTIDCSYCGASNVLWDETPEVIVKEVEWTEGLA